MPESTSISELAKLLSLQQQAFTQQPLPSAVERRVNLQKLRSLLLEEKSAIAAAISADFSHRSVDETYLAEVLPSLEAIDFACKHLKRWMKPSRRSVSLAFQPAAAKVVYQPLGVVGVLVPWNYPLFLSIGPLVGALAAGNRVMIKMSEHTPRTAQLLKALLAKVFAEDLVALVQGETDVAIAFSQLPFDHLLFTGSTQVGRQVMQAAAENLTPVTLELGGKSPTIISEEAPLEETAQRIAFGKTVNAGQTCVAPDYLLVHESRLEELVQAISQAVKKFYPSLAGNSDYTAIINQRQLERLESYIADAKNLGAEVIQLPGSRVAESEMGEKDQRRLPLTLLLNVTDEMQVMQEEIFGPILPIITYKTFDEALDYIRQRPKPLAVYYFGYNPVEQQQVLQTLHAGGVCLNDTLLQVAQEDLPFGGVGASGMGHYHGYEGFLTFSHAKAVFSKPRFNAAKFIYPPYGSWLQKLILRFFLR
ncbi:coniferyl aldehyde dehydrogenase [Marinospirillum insulare]|uniref:Aldehyde dehydrogenase n=1 Tax=Marinospirillum insulare TaxID=217169 RepID=A0ABQ5ZYP6_9GAMM|nr:coniferyl aldehyde dehydrogenase [Marinospirillum insulare]GLR63108.1 putative coniferyl aldehyde dehydrogenase [Marinospirillum insulare]